MFGLQLKSKDVVLIYDKIGGNRFKILSFDQVFSQPLQKFKLKKSKYFKIFFFGLPFLRSEAVE